MVDGTPQRSSIQISQNLRNSIQLVVIAMLLLVSWTGSSTALLPPRITDMLSLIAVFLGYPIYAKAAKSLIGKTIGVPLFVTIAELASVIIGAYLAAGTVVLIILSGTYLEDFILDRTRGAIKKLVQLMPLQAHVLRGSNEVDVPVSDLVVGEIVLARPGEKIPVDGNVLSGASAIDQSAITGESMPIDKLPGDAVFAGTINQGGALKVVTTKLIADSTLSRMIRLVEDAQERKAPIQNIADRFTFYFLPVILLLAGSVFYFSGSLERAVTVLLVACPCAMSLAVPIAVVGAIGNAGTRGILIKGGVFVEALQRPDAILFDKTGTLTSGKPAVTDVVGFDGYQPSDIMPWAATAEKFSEHPLARAVVEKAAGQGGQIVDPDAFEAFPGKGVYATALGHSILLGTRKFLESRNIPIGERDITKLEELEESGATALLLARDGKLMGLVALRDQLKEGLSSQFMDLRTLGMKKLVMLSGDNRRVSGAVASTVGITEVASDLLPGDKAAFVADLQARGNVVVMVGDGVNDAPALATADVGIAMGSRGTDVAIEAADIVLLGDDLAKVSYLIRLSRKAFQKMKMNIGFAIVWNAVGLSLAAMGYLSPILGAVLQEAGCISVVINSALLLRYRPPISDGVQAK